ncbi:MAG: hypothetical protein P0107_04315 [Nitrosomonas sp.]|nr:hypothetical protein [Nitrosomonas sp.]
MDLFVKWRIVDVKQYYVSVRGDGETLAQTRLAEPSIQHALMVQVTGPCDVVLKRDKIMEILRRKANADARGREVVDISGVKRVGCPRSR